MSGGRYRPRRPDELDAARRALHDRIADGPRRAQASLVPVTDGEGRLLGPFGPMTIAPALGDAVQEIGARLRFATTMAAATKETAILLVAARRRCRYEWVLHERAALAEGVGADALETLRAGGVPEGLGAQTDAALRIVDRLLEDGTLTDGDYTAALDALGEVVLAELVWLVGYYSMLALALAVFDPPLGTDAVAGWDEPGEQA